MILKKLTLFVAILVATLALSAAPALADHTPAAVYPQTVTVSPGQTVAFQGILPRGTNPRQVCVFFFVWRGSGTVLVQIYGDSTVASKGRGWQYLCSSEQRVLDLANQGRVVFLVTGQSGTSTVSVDDGAPEGLGIYAYAQKSA